MGKSGSRKKKSNGSASVLDMPAKQEPAKRPDIPSVTAAAPPATDASPATLKMEHLAAVFLRRAHELKEEGNRRFQNKDYHSAMENYEQALRLTPRNHPDRAVFHSNRAACLMQMKPVQYEAVVRECSLALEAHPCFGRALFRRSRALEALGKLELALQDAQLLLQTDGNNPDALELARRLRTALRKKEESSQDVVSQSPASSIPATPTSMHSGTSPAALGASVVNGSPMASKGPPKLIVKKKANKSEQPHTKVPFADARQNIVFSPEGRPSIASVSTTTVKDLVEHGSTDQQPGTDRVATSLQSKVLKLDAHKMPVATQASENQESSSVEEIQPRSSGISHRVKKQSTSTLRPLKLVYDHDIRLAKMPLGCNIKELREVVRKKFPSSKAVLIKYKDADGDLVTITSTEELRLAEAALETEAAKRRCPKGCLNEVVSAESIHSPDPLRLHVVEVLAEQEPVFEDEDNDVPEQEGIARDTFVQHSDVKKENDASLPEINTELSAVRKSRISGSCCEDISDKDDDENKSKEIEMDEWLVDFAQLFRTHIGVDPDVHVDLHELGMELCSEALEETVTSENAQPLFEAAACKFQEVAALAFFNWGNVHMCAARKRIPLEGTSGDAEYQERLQIAYDWAQDQYEQARSKYEEACKVKSDFYEGVLALGQESFESAKLRWSLAIASQADLTTWDSSVTLSLFSKAEERMQTAFVMWEKLEEARLNEAKAGSGVVHREVAKGHRDLSPELSEAETKEQFMVMRFQINLFWGNILFEHSQVQYKLGLLSWKSLLDAAVKKFELAGASPADIAVVMNNHISNSNCACDATKPVTIAGDSTSITKTDSKVVERRDAVTPFVN